MQLDTPRRADRTLLRPFVLLVLRTRPRHGYQLRAELHGFGLPEPDLPALYRLLEDLEAARLVQSTWVAGCGGPARRVYRVTSSGTRQLRRDAQALSELSGALSRFNREWMALDARLAKRRRGARK